MEVFDRLRLVRKHLGLSQSNFAESLGLKQGSYSDIERGRTKSVSDGVIKLISNIYNIDGDWLLTGQGEMINEKEGHIPTSQSSSKENFKLVPMYSLDVVGGINNEECDTMGFITGYMPFVNAKEKDIAVMVTGQSMYPTYPSGSIVQIRKIESWREYLEYGQVYIIELKDGRRLIKEVRKGGDKLSFNLVSHNSRFDENEISIDFIRSVWLVLAKYEKSTM